MPVQYIVVCVLAVALMVTAVPIIDVAASSGLAANDSGSAEVSAEETNSTSNGTRKDLYASRQLRMICSIMLVSIFRFPRLFRYVIKAVVYEIGILTEVNDDDNATTSDDYS